MTESARARHPAVPWTDIIGLRTVLAHHYHRVDPAQVWSIASIEIPKLAANLGKPTDRKMTREEEYEFYEVDRVRSDKDFTEQAKRLLESDKELLDRLVK